ncbi:galactose mutarotase [Elizabethkingia miricola]|nr:galactose mutarotase [Elizabethkingia bruuniana]OPC67247.1 galactose mutarotase [Elizabethkingia bruuniana]RBI93640.1 galactose mutarotase [Elizabethkingia miricola]
MVFMNYRPERQKFQKEKDGKKIDLFQLKNKNNTEVFLTNYGARIVSFLFNDRNNNPVDINLGHASIDEYLEPKGNFYGCVIGRVCNRIGGAEFTLNGKNYQLNPNIPNNLLHGGENGFHTKVFDVENTGDNFVKMTYHSEDGEEGFPGNVKVRVTYMLTDEDALEILFEAESDKETPFNITNHAFFNLNGEGNGDMLRHQLQIFAEKYLQVTENVVPNGTLESVENTPFDFREVKTIGQDINADDQQVVLGSGFDHTYVLKETFDSELLHAAKVNGDLTGIVLDVYTDQPGVHLYTGNFMDETHTLKSGKTDGWREAFCLETQHFPDAVHHDHFPSIILKPGDKFASKTVFKLSNK